MRIKPRCEPGNEELTTSSSQFMQHSANFSLRNGQGRQSPGRDVCSQLRAAHDIWFLKHPPSSAFRPELLQFPPSHNFEDYSP